MYKVAIKRSADKELAKISKSDPKVALKIRTFLRELETRENPFATNNVEKMQGYENRWRWRVGIHYRVIGLKQDEILTIEIIEILSREGAY
jgi:hypothetical protein